MASSLTVDFAVLLTEEEVDAKLLGGKGAALDRLVTHGLPVPATGVVTTHAYRATAAANQTIAELVDHVGAGIEVSQAEVDNVFSLATVPTDVEDSIVRMAADVGAGGQVAVRSSATVEDLSGSSFAGQYRSLLNIDSTDAAAVMTAVRQVWASLWHPAPAAYRQAFGIESDDVAMAVVVMAMIPASSAGVVFTADPGGSEGARIEAVEGLGESLVSGERTPSAWVVPRAVLGTGVPTAGPELPAAAQRALDLAISIEQEFGTPQDVEWAATRDDVFVVQARPITVLDTDDGFDTLVDGHELTTAGIAELVPGVQPALRWELNAFLLEQAFRSVLESLGVIRGGQAEDRRFVRRVRGRMAIDFDQLRDAARGVPGAVAQLELQYFGETDEPDEQSATRIGRLQRFRRDLRTSRTRSWVIDHADVLIAATVDLRDRRPVLDTLSAADLLAYHWRLVDLAARGLIGELGVAAAGGASYDRLVALLDRYLGEGQGAGAAQKVAAHIGATLQREPSASAAVFAGPSWSEMQAAPPAPRTPASSSRRELEELEGRITSMPGWRRRRIITAQFVDVRLHLVRRTVRDVVEQLGRRESAKAAFLELGGEVRRVHLELGKRLCDADLLGEPTDIELLSTGELMAAVEGSLKLPVDALRRRRNWLGRFDVEGQLPLRFYGIPERAAKPLPAGDVLSGWAASPGRKHGRTRVVTHARGRLEPGEILVAEATDASWSPLFVKAGAIVVERGGPLSHAAILARELGLPAVLNVAGATRALEGCTVSVDGDQGVVVIESRGDRP